MPIPVTNGNYPQFKFAVFGDNLSTVVTAGYLNSAAIQAGIPLSNADVIMALYSFNTQTVSGTFGIFTCSISASNGQITLTEWANPGDAVLPTTANYLAHFTNTTGTISSAAGNVTQPGNIAAGLSGTAGTVSSFPAAAAKGSLILAGVANTGNTNTTISNAAMGQASVISIPDPGNALGEFVIGAGATPFVSGNFPQNSGTAGLMVDSGIAVSSLATTSTAVLLTPAADQTITVHNLSLAQGNLTAGSSGHAGTLASFPATAANGSLIVAGVNAGGAFNTTISNSTMGQSSVLSIPDPANAVGKFLVGAGATPFVSGNFPQNSGTAGLMVDSGVTVASLSGAVTQLGKLFQVSVTFNTASMITAYDTPLTIIANPAASQMILVLQASVYTASTGNTPYATGTAPIIQYSTGGTNGQHGAGTIATAAGLAAGDITAAASQVRNLFGIATGAQTGLSGKGLYFSNATGDYTAGTGTNITITVVYQLLTATV